VSVDVTLTLNCGSAFLLPLRVDCLSRPRRSLDRHVATMSRPIPRFSDYCRHVVCTTLWHCDPLPPRKTSRGTGPTTCLVITSPRRESQYIGDGQWMPGTRRHGLSCTMQRIEDIWRLSSCCSITVPMQMYRTNNTRQGHTWQHKMDTFKLWRFQWSVVPIRMRGPITARHLSR